MDQPLPYWHIESVTDGQMFGGASGIVLTKDITVKLNTDGSTFVVQIPKSQFNAASVQKLIESQIDNELQVRALRGPDLPA